MKRGDPLRVRDYLAHIVLAAENIRQYTAGLNRDAFLADNKTQDAVIRNFEVIGEACNRIVTEHAAFAATHPEVPWAAAYGMRNALAHDSFKVDHQIVWTTIQTDPPRLEAAVQKAIEAWT